MICIGFAGCEAFDILLYLSRTLVRLNYPVLIIDFSDTGALEKAIYHGMNLDSSQDIVNYRNIHYLRRYPVEDELMSYQEGLVLINYGFHPPKELPLNCNLIYVVMNTYPHIIDKINALISNSEWKEVEFKLLIRDIITPDDIDRVISKVKFPYDTRQYHLFLDHDDYFCSVNCQIQQSIKFIKLSSGMRKFIINSIHEIFPQIRNNKIKRAFTSAGRGR
jgi:hypothetical protein